MVVNVVLQKAYQYSRQHTYVNSQLLEATIAIDRVTRPTCCVTQTVHYLRAQVD